MVSLSHNEYPGQAIGHARLEKFLPVMDLF